jgi:tetratricopeptide (TPR) repeat protein
LEKFVLGKSIYYLLYQLIMSSEYQENDAVETREATSSVAKMLLGKVLHHKIFSDGVLLWLILGLSFLLPLFFVPGQVITPEFSKMILLEVVVLFGVFAWSAARLRDGKVTVPKSILLLVSFLLVVQFVVAAIVSPTPLISFVGSGYDLGTVNAFAVLFLLMFLSSVVFSTRDRILSLYASFVFSGALVMLYHLARYSFGAGFLDFGIFTSDVSTPIGKWNDMASMVGGMMILLLTTLYFFPQNKALRLPAYAIFAVGLFLLLLIDFTILWLILFVLLAVLCVLAVYEGEQSHKRALHEAAQSGTTHAHKAVHKRVVHHLPALAVVLLVISFVFGSGLSTMPWGKDSATIARLMQKTFHAASYSEVVLTPSVTYDVVKASIAQSPFFGSGPNRFSSTFLLNKNSAINRSPFWDTSFDFGLGRIPTYFGTTGIIGMLLWIIFIAIIFMKGRKVMKLFAQDRIASYLAFSLFILTLYFWSLAFFYLPNISIFSLAFLFTGALVAFLVGEGVLETYNISFEGNTRLSFVATPVVIIVLVGTIASGVLLYRQVSSLVAFRDAQIAINAGNIELAQADILHANSLSERDLYQRSLSNIGLVNLTQLAKQDLPPAELAAKANIFVNDARGHAERAVILDPTNFENYLQLGGVYDTLGSLGIQNTTQAARENYEQALRLNPKSPRVLFVIARLEYVSGDHVKAKEYLYKALAERPNYLEAVSFLTQLELQDKNPEGAVSALQASIIAEPNNFLLRFALGYLEYAKRDYPSAINQFEAAVLLNPAYADAKYFLGLAYSRVNRTQEAIQQFTDVQTLNPDNKDVAAILRNLKAGREAFDAGYSAPTQPVEDALSELNKPQPTNP